MTVAIAITVSEFNMKNVLLAVLFATSLAACQSTEQQDRAAVGAGLGAVGGALAGAAIDDSGSDVDGALIGAGIGAVSGAVVGAATTPAQRCVNQFGEPVPCP